MPDTTDLMGEEALREFDRIPVRMLTEDDLDAIVRIDKRVVGHSRHDYLKHKLAEAMRDTRIMVSLGTEVDGNLAGFLMGRLYYGEFGVADPVAILDTIGVDPERPRAAEPVQDEPARRRHREDPDPGGLERVGAAGLPRARGLQAPAAAIPRSGYLIREALFG